MRRVHLHLQPLQLPSSPLFKQMRNCDIERWHNSPKLMYWVSCTWRNCVSFFKLETSCHKKISIWRKQDISEMTKEGHMYLVLGLYSCAAFVTSMQQNNSPFQGRLAEIGPWTWITTEDQNSQILSSYMFHRNNRCIPYLFLCKGDPSTWQCRGVCGEKSPETKPATVSLVVVLACCYQHV